MATVRWRVGMTMALALTTGSTTAAPLGVVILKPDLNVTLRTGATSDHAGFEGVDGVVSGVINPTLTVRQGAVVRIVVESGDDQRHQLVIPDLELASEPLEHAGARTGVVFRAKRRGRFDYFCSTPGHREAGAAGVLIVGEPAAASRRAPDGSLWSETRQ